MVTALFFGSFNPIHIGHLALAQYALNSGVAEDVWFVVSPHNPFKSAADLAPAETRIGMVRMATEGDERMRVEDIETRLPQPSYTINTLDALEREYPGREFVILMGEDNLEGLVGWREAERLIGGRTFVVYPRLGVEADGRKVEAMGGKVVRLDAPRIEISSTQIRRWIGEGKRVRHFVPDQVVEMAEKIYRRG